MRLQIIVEGDADVKAAPILFRRLMERDAISTLRIEPPIKRNRSDLAEEEKFRRAIRLASYDCDAVLVLFDGDDDCPRELASKMQSWARSEAGHIPCEIVIAHREYEAWFLGSIESLRGRCDISAEAAPPSDPEAVRDAKGWLAKQMPGTRRYKETTDQPKLTAAFDFQLAYDRCRSFRKLIAAWEKLVSKLNASSSDLDG